MEILRGFAIGTFLFWLFYEFILKKEDDKL